ncbi:MAG TPA: hypothetical protein VE993_15150 [Stellaceae bacterium]|nr:hypothetical protein [Stellaceae bacterium]
MINEKQLEYGKTVVAQQTQQPNESLQQFQERRAWVERAFVTKVSVTGVNGEVVTGQGEDFMESVNIPEHILTVFYSTVTAPTAMPSGFVPQSKATVLLDFSRPPVLDFTKLPTLPTLNNSNFNVSSNSEFWFTALNSRINQFFVDRRTSYDWLPKSGVYDLLFLFVAIPLALWVDYRIATWHSLQGLPNLIQSAVYLRIFIGNSSLSDTLLLFSMGIPQNRNICRRLTTFKAPFKAPDRLERSHAKRCIGNHLGCN